MCPDGGVHAALRFAGRDRNEFANSAKKRGRPRHDSRSPENGQDPLLAKLTELHGGQPMRRESAADEPGRIQRQGARDSPTGRVTNDIM